MLRPPSALAFTLASLVATTSVARADVDAPTATEKSPRTAMALGMAGGLAPVLAIFTGVALDSDAGNALIWAGVGGVMIGPALGHLYTHEPSRALLGIVARTGGTVAAGYGIRALVRNNLLCGDHCHQRGAIGNGLGTTMLVGGLLVFATGTALDLLDAGAGATRWNEHHIEISPTLVGTVDQPSFGLAASGAF